MITFLIFGTLIVIFSDGKDTLIGEPKSGVCPDFIPLAFELIYSPNVALVSIVD